ncbi:hypothetical protein D3C75_1236780 [compost metagenome]
MGDDVEVIHQAQSIFGVAKADQRRDAGTAFVRFGSVDQLFNHPVIEVLAFSATEGHAQLFLQRLQRMAFGEQGALRAIQGGADAVT